MKHTSIQWTHSTINPTSGCDGCELYRRPPPNLTPEQLKEWLKNQECYASQVHHNRWAKSLAITHPELYSKHFHEVRTIAGRMAEAASWGPVTDKEAKDKPWFTTRRRHIFISDMSDALSRDVPFEFMRDEIVGAVVSEKGRRHVWQWLTKRPERMAAFDEWLFQNHIDWPDNLWAGTSVTSQRTADVRVPSLLKVRAKVRFLSCEPLFEAVDLTRITVNFDDGFFGDCLQWYHRPHGDTRAYPKIDWVIVGGASGHNAAPFDVRWARSICRQCKAAGVACFVKQLGANPYSSPEHDGATGYELSLRDGHGGDWNEWPQDLRVRELPSAA